MDKNERVPTAPPDPEDTFCDETGMVWRRDPNSRPVSPMDWVRINATAQGIDISASARQYLDRVRARKAAQKAAREAAREAALESRRSIIGSSRRKANQGSQDDGRE